jgi:hypothetical protein
LARAIRIALRVAAVAIVAGFVAMLFHRPFQRVIGGSVIMLAAFVGWGEVIERFVLRSVTRSNWGLRAAWGMAATLAIGGVAGALHVAGRAMFITQLGVGCAVFVVSFVRSSRRFVSKRWALRAFASPVTLALVLIATVAVLLRTMGDVATTWMQPSDDPALYWPFAEDFLRTGTLIEPFCFRRITTYGGQSYLHAIALLYSRHDQLFSMDGGVGLAMVMGLAAGDALRRPKGRVVRLAMVVAFVISLGQVRQNVASLMTDVASMYALYVTTARIASRRAAGALAWREAIVIGGLVGTNVVLRTSNAVAVCSFVACALFVCRGGFRRRWSLLELLGYLRDGVMCAVVFVAFMVPWAVMFHASIGTYVYPLSKGNLTPGFELLHKTPGWVPNVRAIVVNFAHDRPIIALAPLLVAGVIVGARRTDVRAVVPAAVATSLLAFVTMVVAGGGFDADIMARYYYAYVVATALLVIAWADLSPRRLDVADVLVMFGAFAQATLNREDTKKRYTEALDDIERTLDHQDAEQTTQDERTHRYRVIQSFVPRGERAVTAVAEPYRFELARNDLKLLDQPGAIGPSPGFPVHGGPEGISQYLRSNGFRYMIVVSFYGGHELYDINHWKTFIPPPVPPAGKESARKDETYLAIEAPLQIAASESLDELRKTKTIYEDMGIAVVDLEKK